MNEKSATVSRYSMMRQLVIGGVVLAGDAASGYDVLAFDLAVGAIISVAFILGYGIGLASKRTWRLRLLGYTVTATPRDRQTGSDLRSYEW